jgi:uncharacterized RmlC-like cupin family protein
MLRVSTVDGWLTRPRAAGSARPDLRTHGDCVIIRIDCRRSGGDKQPGGSGPSSGSKALRLHLAMIPPGARGVPHYHADEGTAIYLVSGETELWHGPGLVTRSAVRAGDFIYIPPGTPHLAVNRRDVTSIAVVARTDPADRAGAVVIELPRHLAGLTNYPIGSGE